MVHKSCYCEFSYKGVSFLNTAVNIYIYGFSRNGDYEKVFFKREGIIIKLFLGDVECHKSISIYLY